VEEIPNPRIEEIVITGIGKGRRRRGGAWDWRRVLGLNEERESVW